MSSGKAWFSKEPDLGRHLLSRRQRKPAGNSIRIDGYYLFGKRAWNGSIDLIGGGAQADELMISGGPNVEQNLYKEIHEEVGIWEDEIEELAGIGIVFSGTSNVLIIGHARAGLLKTDAIARFGQRAENEMTEPIFVHEDKTPPPFPAGNDRLPQAHP